MDIFDPPFLPGYSSNRKYPLERYLPPMPSGIAASWLQDKLPPGSWVLDPFGASPQLALEIARCGYRLLVSVNNPIMAFILETLSEASSHEDYQSALADLASVRKGDERLEKHIQALYSVECPQCHTIIQAKAFIWQHPAEQPDACLITCPICGDEGERPLPVSYREHLLAASSKNLHHSRALERVIAVDDPARPNVDLALTCYPARQLYGLFTLINRLEGISFSFKKKRLLTALILSICDEANTLWPYPTQRNRPRQLVIPPHYKENNLWNALEDAVEVWQGDGKPIPLVHWPEQPAPDGGICLFPGRLRELAPNLSSVPIKAIITAIPRPNQAFLTLSALWSGWLWGRNAVTPIKSVLTRQRYDWSWLANALESTFSSLQPQVDLSAPILGLISESEPSFLTAALLAADQADFNIGGIALRSNDSLAQIRLNTSKHSVVRISNTSIETIAQNAILEHLITRSEPAPYPVLHAVAISAMARAHALKPEDEQSASTWLPKLTSHIQRIFVDKDLLVSFGYNPTSIDKSVWWLNHVIPENIPLADRVEIEVVRYIQKHPEANLLEVDQAICLLFPGLMTPPQSLVTACLESYCEVLPPDSITWRMKPSEIPAIRKVDLNTIKECITQTGGRFNFAIEDGNPLVWRDKEGKLILAFYLAASAVIGRFVYSSSYPPDQCIIVLPGSRVELISYKIARDPLLNQTIAKGWKIIKFRHLRALANQQEINFSSWQQQLDSDRIDNKAIQLEMF